MQMCSIELACKTQKIVDSERFIMTDPSDFWHILPNYVKKDVVHYLDFKTRCNLSYCSKSDFKLVKSTPITFRYIIWNGVYPHIDFNTLNCPKDRSTKLGITCVDRLCDMLRAPNTCKWFSFPQNHSDAIRLIRELKVKNIHPRVQSLKWVHTIGDIFYEFLTQIDADYLDKLFVNSLDGTKEQIGRIIETEQWKKLKVVDIQYSQNPTRWLESLLHKPIFAIHRTDFSVDETRWIVKTFQEKNHPLGSCFKVTFLHNRLNVRELYEDLGQRIVESQEHTIYLKKFPLSDEALELRVQLPLLQPCTDMEVREISGVVVRKDADMKYVDVSEIMWTWL